MGRKFYGGYRSWSFLEPNKDYKSFKLAKEVGRVPSSRVELSKVGRRGLRSLLRSTY
ncbi:MAG: hypothetical protein ACP5GZ_11540 [Vulcanisaeta sp.]|uniref:hypothetical protein n=1 Tax=Vulcanisaeta sp. TaxID=2020871 RepID=UPI003D0FA31D